MNKVIVPLHNSLHQIVTINIENKLNQEENISAKNCIYPIITS